MLCEDCEAFIGKSEVYVHDLSRGQPADLARIGVTLEADNMVTGIDRGLLFRFIASFLLRSHGAVSAPHIRLRHALVTELRTAILQDNYPASRHQLSMGKVYTRARVSAVQANPRANAIRAVREQRGIFEISAILGGLAFVYVFRAADGRNARWDQHPFRQHREPIAVGETEMMLGPVELFELEIFRLDLAGRDDEELDLDAGLPPFDLDLPCPCGWNVGTLRDCCASTWLQVMLEPDH